MKKKVLLIGGMNKAKSLAASLIAQGYYVTVINKSLKDCTKLAEMKNLNVYHGDGTKLYALDEAGADECSIAIALTFSDQDNLVACQMCKRNFGVKKTVALVSDPEKIEFFHQMGVDRVVCAISTVTSIIQQQAFVDDMVNVLPIGHGAVQIAEVNIPKDSAAAGKRLMDINLPDEAVVGCILRRDHTIIPRGDTVINGGDNLVVIASTEHEMEAIKILTAGR